MPVALAVVAMHVFPPAASFNEKPPRLKKTEGPVFLLALRPLWHLDAG